MGAMARPILTAAAQADKKVGVWSAHVFEQEYARFVCVCASGSNRVDAECVRARARAHSLVFVCVCVRKLMPIELIR